MTQASASNYWISNTALSITLNALGEPDRIQGSSSSGAVIMCYIRGVNGLEFDDGHNYKRWNLSCSPTVFVDSNKKYIYVAIPRPTADSNISQDNAFVCFPSEVIDLYGQNAGGTQIGSTNYYYINLGGLIASSVDSSTGDKIDRVWSQTVNYGTLATDEAIAGGGADSWWQYSSVDNTIQFLKTIADATFNILRLSGGYLNKIAVFMGLTDDDEHAVVTTHYLRDRESAVEQKYIRKDGDDTDAYKLSLGALQVNGQTDLKDIINAFATLQSNHFSRNMATGVGWGVDHDGNMQVESLEVRSALRVLELVYNRLSAEESEYVFTESGTIETVVEGDNNTYVCTLKKRSDTDFHAFRKGDVLRGIVNNLQNLGAGEYYTIWMRVEDIDTACTIEGDNTSHANTITVSLYADEDTPAGKNYSIYPLAAPMVIQRWGNAIIASEDTHNVEDYKTFIVKKEGEWVNTRQSCWYISSLEKRITMLDGVRKPILEESNYAAFFGLPTNIVDENGESKFKGHTLNYAQPYLYCRGAFLQDVHYIDYLGNQMLVERYRGDWSATTAAITDPNATGYNPYCVNDYTYDTVFHEGTKWQCCASGITTQEPGSGSDWIKIGSANVMDKYTIIPHYTQILREEDGSTNLPDDKLECDVILDNGNGEPTYADETEVNVYVGHNSEEPVACPSRQVIINADDTSIEFYLWNKSSNMGSVAMGDSLMAYLTNKVSVSIITKGENGITPVIDENTGNWIINGEVTEFPSKGDDGHNPVIGEGQTIDGQTLPNDGYWYEWNPNTNKYEKTSVYAKGNSVIARYSKSNSVASGSDWHTPFVVGDLWMRTSEDNGTTWGDPMLIVGEKGNGGDYIDSSFGISSSTTSPNDASWSDAPVDVTDDQPYLWMRQMLKTWDDALATPAYKNGWSTYKYVRLTGEKGANADTFALSASRQIVACNEELSPKDTSDIIVAASHSNVAGNVSTNGAWSIEVDGSAANTNLYKKSGDTLTIYGDKLETYFTKEHKTITVSATLGDYTDTISIVRVDDGAKGDDAYTIILTNESQPLASDENGNAIATTIESEVIAYKGTSPIDYTIESIEDLPTGMTYDETSKSNGIIKISVLSTFSTANGSIKIVIKADGITFTKYLSYTLNTVKQGAQGARGAVLRGPSEWTVGTYYQSGADGEDYIDIVYHPSYPSELFLCKVSHTAIATGNPGANEPSDDTIANESWSATKPWTSSDIKQFIATKFLLTEQIKTDILTAIQAQIDQLEVRKLTSYGTKTVVQIADGQLTIGLKNSTIPNIRMGIDDGAVVLKFYDKYGNFKYDLGPDGIKDVTDSTGYEEQWTDWSMYQMVGCEAEDYTFVNRGSLYKYTYKTQTFYVYHAGWMTVGSDTWYWNRETEAYDLTAKPSYDNRLVKTNNDVTLIDDGWYRTYDVQEGTAEDFQSDWGDESIPSSAVRYMQISYYQGGLISSSKTLFLDSDWYCCYEIED